MAVAQPTLPSFIQRIESLEAITEGWDESHRLTLLALKEAVEALHKEAFTRLIRGLKADAAAAPALRDVVRDEVVYAVLRHLQLLKPSLNERIEEALASVRPLLHGHGGNVELVRIDPPDAVELRLVGTCDGCPASELTLVEGIEKAIRQHCPEITTIKKAKGKSPASNNNGGLVSLVSPFATESQSDWRMAADLKDIPDGAIKALEVAGHSLLVSRRDRTVTCFENACAHMGMPLDRGVVSEGILTCPHHGFRYDLASGACLTAPEVRLVTVPHRIVGTNLELKLRRSGVEKT